MSLHSEYKKGRPHTKRERPENSLVLKCRLSVHSGVLTLILWLSIVTSLRWLGQTHSEQTEYFVI
jgi:hypothetical protein